MRHSARRPTISLAAVAALLALASSAGCRAGADASSAAQWRGTIDSLPNGALAVRNPATGVWDSASAWRLKEELRIGAMEGDGPDVLSDVRDLAVDAAGRIYVLQNTAKRITVFDREGRFVRHLGGQGGGPGEFEDPNGMQFDPSERLWVSDPGNERYTAFDSTGTMLASHPRRLSMYGFRWDGRFMDDGTLVEPDALRWIDGDYGDGFVRFDTAFATVDTLLRTPPPPPTPEGEGDYFILRSGTTRWHVQIPFRVGPISLLDPTGHQWIAVAVDYQLVQRRLDGDTVRIVTREFAPIPVTDADRAASREGNARFVDAPGWDESRIPKVKPAFQQVVRSTDGYLWLRLYSAHDASRTTFDVIDPDGRYLGQVFFPRELALYPQPYIGPDFVLGVVRDELDVPQVVRWEIVR